MPKGIAVAGALAAVGVLALIRWRAEPASSTGRDPGSAGAPAAAAIPPAPPAAPSPPAPPPSQSAASVPSAPAAPIVAAGPGQGAAVDALNEAVLMARLRSAGGTDAALAIELARAGNRRFPDSPEAPERASILIHALASQGLAREARGEAEYMVNHYPDSSWVREVESFTGAHRHRNISVTDAGTIEYH